MHATLTTRPNPDIAGPSNPFARLKPIPLTDVTPLLSFC